MFIGWERIKESPVRPVSAGSRTLRIPSGGNGRAEVPSVDGHVDLLQFPRAKCVLFRAGCWAGAESRQLGPKKHILCLMRPKVFESAAVHLVCSKNPLTSNEKASTLHHRSVKGLQFSQQNLPHVAAINTPAASPGASNHSQHSSAQHWEEDRRRAHSGSAVRLFRSRLGTK